MMLYVGTVAQLSVTRRARHLGAARARGRRPASESDRPIPGRPITESPISLGLRAGAAVQTGFIPY